MSNSKVDTISINQEMTITHFILNTLTPEQHKKCNIAFFEKAYNENSETVTVQSVRNTVSGIIYDNSTYNSKTNKGETMCTLKSSDLNSDTLRFVDDFINNSSINLVEKFKVLFFYTFEKKKEIWVIVEDINSDIILEFDDIVYEIIKDISFDLMPIIIGKSQINENSIPVYDKRIEA